MCHVTLYYKLAPSPHEGQLGDGSDSNEERLTAEVNTDMLVDVKSVGHHRRSLSSKREVPVCTVLQCTSISQITFVIKVLLRGTCEKSIKDHLFNICSVHGVGCVRHSVVSCNRIAASASAAVSASCKTTGSPPPPPPPPPPPRTMVAARVSC